MLININEALEARESLDLDIDGDEIIGLAVESQVEGHGEVVPDKLDFSFVSPVKVHLDLSSTGRDVIVTGSVKTELTLQCSRCLKDYLFPVDSTFTIFAPLAKEAEARPRKAAKKKSSVKSSELSDEESAVEREISHIEDGELNLTDLLLEEVSLAAPTKPLCKKSCKGLCLSCGTDLNTEKCKCAEDERIDPRFSKLKEFKIK